VAVLAEMEGLQKKKKKNCNFLRKKYVHCEKVACGAGSGSGWMVVVPLDRGDQCGSNGTK
jgi:hypothetical protein